jgi:ribosome-binding protein aMBF1 (putative translation factor)
LCEDLLDRIGAYIVFFIREGQKGGNPAMPMTREEAKRKDVLLRRFGEEIVAERTARGWSRASLADRLGVEKERLGRWERGERTPPLPVLYRLKEVLGVPKYDLNPSGTNGGSGVVKGEGVCATQS